jgi:hypothetical protein
MAAREQLDCQPAERDLQLLSVIAHALVDIDSKLDDLVTLSQQQTDLLRALLKKEQVL